MSLNKIFLIDNLLFYLDEQCLLDERIFAEQYLSLKTRYEEEEVNAQLKWNKKKYIYKHKQT